MRHDQFEPAPIVVEKLKMLVEQKKKEQLRKEVPPLKHDPVVIGHKTGRNDPCPCGSGKKYKKCCMAKH